MSFAGSVRTLENFPINATQARKQENHGDNGLNGGGKNMEEMHPKE